MCIRRACVGRYALSATLAVTDGFKTLRNGLRSSMRERDKGLTVYSYTPAIDHGQDSGRVAAAMALALAIKSRVRKATKL